MPSFKRKEKGVVKGAMSGFLISVIVHVAAFLLAGMLVVFTVMPKKEAVFVPPTKVERPKMKIKKPQVKLQKSVKPQSPTRIVSRMKNSTMPDIQLPDLTGIGDGMGTEIDTIEMPPIEEINLIGRETSMGSDFVGEVYSFLHNRTFGKIAMDGDEFRQILRDYVLSGWDDSFFSRYYRSPKKLYATNFMVPPVPTALLPGFFGVRGLEDYYLFVKYEGQLVHSTDIKFRFWAVGDAYIFVNVDGKEVVKHHWEQHFAYFDWWDSTGGSDRTYLLGSQFMAVGDWIELKAGEPLDMKVLFGEWAGGKVAGMLLVEVEGVEYPKSAQNGPLLPAFRTEELSFDTITQISRFLAADECTLNNGPLFNDFGSGTNGTAVGVGAYEPEPQLIPNIEVDVVDELLPKPVQRVWTMTDGKTAEAKLMTVMGKDVVLKDPKGKQLRIPKNSLSEADQLYVELTDPPDLDINFSYTTKQLKYGETGNGQEPPVKSMEYTFKSTIKKKRTSHPYSKGMTAEMFAIGEEIGGEKYKLLAYQKADFTLTEEGGYAFTFEAPPAELLDYVITDEAGGEKYAGHLVVVKDSQGKVIEYKATKEGFFENIKNLRAVKPGWYFDDDCKISLPTPRKNQPGENPF